MSQPGVSDVHADGAGGADPIRAKRRKAKLYAEIARGNLSKTSTSAVSTPNQSSLYVRRNLKNADDLHTWAAGAGIPNLVPPNEMHVTQVYSRKPVALDKKTNDVTAAGGDRDIAQLGDKGAVVLHFESPDLDQRHVEAMEAGASHDWPQFLTHVTLSYDAGGKDLSKVKPPTFPLVFGPEVHEPINDNWAEEKGLRKFMGMIIKSYSPDQARDEKGKFAPKEGGGDTSSSRPDRGTPEGDKVDWNKFKDALHHLNDDGKVHGVSYPEDTEADEQRQALEDDRNLEPEEAHYEYNSQQLHADQSIARGLRAAGAAHLLGKAATFDEIVKWSVAGLAHPHMGNRSGVRVRLPQPKVRQGQIARGGKPAGNAGAKMFSELRTGRIAFAPARTPHGVKKFVKTDVIPDLGLVFGWAIICKQNGQDYWDVQGNHIPESAMLEAAADFMENSRAGNDMHAGPDQGTYVFAFPVTTEIAKAMGMSTQTTGLIVGAKPPDEILALYKNGTYTGFSIEGWHIDLEDAA